MNTLIMHCTNFIVKIAPCTLWPTPPPDWLLGLYWYWYYIDIGTDITSIGIGQLQACDTDISVEQFKYYEKCISIIQSTFWCTSLTKLIGPNFVYSATWLQRQRFKSSIGLIFLLVLRGFLYHF